MKIEEKSEGYNRIKNIVGNGKTVVGESVKSVIIHDFERTLQEYFELSSVPKMEISYENGGYNVEISFLAERIKQFSVLK